MEYFSPSWKGLGWSPWVPFTGPPRLFREIPTHPGVYRVRPAGGSVLSYVGQTGRSLRERFGALRVQTQAAVMPFNDPHTAAAAHWALRDGEGMQFEFSAAPTDLPEGNRKGLECYLLWQYRLAHGESTLCNHGRFPKNYSRPSNRGKGRRGGRLPEGQSNLAGGPSMPPLQGRGTFLDQGWMGLRWSGAKPLEALEIGVVPAL